MELTGIYNAETLDPLFQEGQISKLEYLFHHEEKKYEYEEFCKERKLQMNDESADAFFIHQQEVEKDMHLNDE